jgi:hypothetical protein
MFLRAQVTGWGDSRMGHSQPVTHQRGGILRDYAIAESDKR